MSKTELPYSQQRLPDLVETLKSQVKKNMDIINREVENDLPSDKYVNVLKGRRLAVEYSVEAMKRIDKIEQDLKINKEQSFYKENLPEFIDRLKTMFDLNLEVVDIDIDEEDFGDNLKKQIGGEIQEIFGDDIAKKIFKKIGNDGLTEDKFHNVLKARDLAGTDNEWLLGIIDDLENILYEKESKTNKKPSWSKIAASA